MQRAGEDANHYFIHGDFYKTLARIRGRLLISAAPAYQVGGTLDERRQSIGVASAHPAISYAPERAGNGYADPIDFDGLVTARLLKSIGVEQADYDLLLEPDIHDPAINAGKALDQLRDTRLGRELRQLERRLHVALEAEHKAIEASLQDDVQRHVLVNVNPRIYSLLPALMLSRRGPFDRLLRDMIAKLEEAASDTGHRSEDHELLRGLRALKEKLSRLDRQSATSWFNIGNALLGYDESSVEEMPLVATNRPLTKQ